LLGLRMIVKPRSGGGPAAEEERGAQACYRVRQVAQQLWKDHPDRYKVRPPPTPPLLESPLLAAREAWPLPPGVLDCPCCSVTSGALLWVQDYIGRPKKNGYQSLHMLVQPSPRAGAPPVELQIRTERMDAQAVSGAAAHGAYKGGLTDPQQVSPPPPPPAQERRMCAHLFSISALRCWPVHARLCVLPVVCLARWVLT
jgi:hypothetical protein